MVRSPLTHAQARVFAPTVGPTERRSWTDRGRGDVLRWSLVAVMLVSYAVLTVAVVVGSPLDRLDAWAAGMHLSDRWPGATTFLTNYVVAGQRGPSAIVAGSYLAWVAWRRRSCRPLVVLAVGLLALNVSVGGVKLVIGRLGPKLTTMPRDVFAGGNIYPSGHVSNAVVVVGVLVLVARRRRALIAAGVALATTIGLGTVLLDTHWVTDVLGGWLAGGLVVALLPEMLQLTEHLLHRVLGRRRDRSRDEVAQADPGPVQRAGAASGRAPEQRGGRRPALGPHVGSA